MTDEGWEKLVRGVVAEVEGQCDLCNLGLHEQLCERRDASEARYYQGKTEAYNFVLAKLMDILGE